MKIIILNGPPLSGKDEVAKAIGVSEVPRFGQEKFAIPLRRGIGGLLGIHNDSLYERKKREDPRIRQLMIGLSEDVVKPIMGMDWFAKACAHRIMETLTPYDHWVVSDCGFQYELDAFIEYVTKAMDCELPPKFQLWRITRSGCDFRNDSRELVVLPKEYGNTIHIQNNGTIGQLNIIVDYYRSAFIYD